MIRVYLLIAVLSVSSLFVQNASASTLTYHQLNPPWTANLRSPTALAACQSYNPNVNASYRLSGNSCYRTIWGSESFVGVINTYTSNCPLGHNTSTLTCNSVLPTCPDGQAFNATTNTCPPPIVNPCAVKTGTTSNFKKTYASFDDYQTLPENVSQGGCSLTIGSMTCGTSGDTGEFTCIGTGTYTGAELAPVEDGSITQTEEPTLPPTPPPLATTSDQQCSSTGANTVTCVTESSSTEYASAQCSVGSTGGATGLVCVKPDYVPEHAGKEQTVTTTTTQNPDGSTTTGTTTTTNNTHCTAGACTTTTTTTTGTKTTDANGNVTGESETCTGPNCEKPEDETEPGKLPASFKPEAFTVDTDLDEQESFTASTQAFYNRIAQAPLVSALNNIEVPSGGACNIGSANLFGGSISFNHFCEIAPNILSGLTYLFLAIWAWAAIRLFFTA